MKSLIKTIAPALVIIAAWIFWLAVEAYLIRKGLDETSWYAYRAVILMAVLSSLLSGMLIYISEDKERVKWLAAGALVPYLLSFLFKAFGWHLNFEIVLRELADDFYICGVVMMFSIPLSAYLKNRHEDM